MSKRLTHKTAILWFRNDLRLHDNYSLHQSISTAESILPVYIFDRRNQTAHSLSRVGNYPRAGVNRLKFALESVFDLQRSLQDRGSNLVIRVGIPEIELSKLAQATGASLVVAHKEVTSEEIAVENKLANKLSQFNSRLELVWDNTMYHIDDLPFGGIKNVPDVYTTFRKNVENKSEVRDCLPIPTHIPPLPSSFQIPPTDLKCTLEDLGITQSQEELDNKIPGSLELKFCGGESAGLARLEEYFFHQDCLKDYKETRNQMLGPNYSSKFSAWLAFGCISPRKIYESVKKYESERVANKSTYWMLFELLWRDYFRFWVYKVGTSVFRIGGPKNRLDLTWSSDKTLLKAWCTGMTGIPLIDACMRELAFTGFMSNRGRQNVCSFLARDMGLDWRLGAEWFENQLIDYDVCSNWGNWVYGTGVGNDPRDDRYFHILKQSSVYDPDGTFIKYWCPELQNLPNSIIHTPWKMNGAEQTKYKCVLGKDYPKPVTKLKSGMNPWKANNRRAAKPFK